MIIFDTETTGLIEKGAVPLTKQPFIIELFAAKLDDDNVESGEIVESIHFLAKPPIPLSPKITEITGLTDEDLKDAKPFAAFYKELVDFFFGERVLVAHNLAYDVGMMTLELRRLDRMTRFPWPPEHKCTMELTKHLHPRGKWMKQEQLYKHYFKVDPKQTHRAESDVLQLIKIVGWMRGEGLL